MVTECLSQRSQAAGSATGDLHSPNHNHHFENQDSNLLLVFKFNKVFHNNYFTLGTVLVKTEILVDYFMVLRSLNDEASLHIYNINVSSLKANPHRK